MISTSRWKPYPETKDSGTCLRASTHRQVEWLGQIPAHWELVLLKRVCSFAYGDSLASDLRVDGEIDVFGSNGPVGLHDKANTLGPCLVIGRKGSFGKVNYSDGPVFAIDTTYYIDSRLTDRNLRWLFYVLQWAKLDSGSRDAAIPGLDREDAYTRVVPLAPSAEQQAIAEFLDRETAKIDALVEKKERLIELLQEKRTALITHAVTKGLPAAEAAQAGLDPDVPMKDSGTCLRGPHRQIEWLGQIPSNWQVASLGVICPFISYGFTNPMPAADDGPYMLTANDIGDGVVRFDTARRTSQTAFDRLLTDKSRPIAGDVLVTKDGTLGRVAVFDGARACINQSVALLRADTSRMIPEYLALTLRSSFYLDRLLAGAGGTAIKHLYITRMARLRLAYPSIEEQQAIVTRTSDDTAKIDTLIAKVGEAIERLKEYRTALISAAVTGKIDVREAVR